MTESIQRPAFPIVSFEAAGEALDRLLAKASGTSGGERRVANFLLAWWDGEKGLISMADLCMLDMRNREDVLTIITYLAQNDVTYAHAWGRRDEMAELAKTVFGDDATE